MFSSSRVIEGTRGSLWQPEKISLARVSGLSLSLSLILVLCAYYLFAVFMPWLHNFICLLKKELKAVFLLGRCLLFCIFEIYFLMR